jgi:hypothetical protein
MKGIYFSILNTCINFGKVIWSARSVVGSSLVLALCWYHSSWLGRGRLDAEAATLGRVGGACFVAGGHSRRCRLIFLAMRAAGRRQGAGRSVPCFRSKDSFHLPTSPSHLGF